jgi:predicted transcriptional regulator
MSVTLRVGIGSPAEFQRILALAAQDPSPSGPEPEAPAIWFPSMAAFTRAVTGDNGKLLSLIMKEKPASLIKLAEKAGKTERRTRDAVRALEKYGLLKLYRDQFRLRPEIYYDDIQLDIYLAAEPEA